MSRAEWTTADAQPHLGDVMQAYIDGARDGRKHPNVTDAQIERAADGYIKTIWNTDLESGALLRRTPDAAEDK